MVLREGSTLGEGEQRGGEQDESQEKITSDTTEDITSLLQNPMDAKIESMWQDEHIKFQAIKEAGGIQNFIQQNGIELRNFIDVHNKNKGHACLCMDDRTEGFGLNLAGSGILLAESLEGGIEELAEIIIQINKNSPGKIQKITSHQDCGAAGIYCDIKGFDRQDAEAHAKDFSERLAQLTGLPYEHLELSEPHGARSIYIDFTGDFHAEPTELPNGFNITASKDFLSNIPQIQEHIVTQADVAMQIASGDHGFGERISGENPFYVFIVQYKGQQLDSSIIQGLDDLEKKYEGRLVVDTLTL